MKQSLKSDVDSPLSPITQHSVTYDLLPAKRHRNGRVSDAGVVLRTDIDVVSHDSFHGTGGWRPSVGNSSIWRSIAGNQPPCAQYRQHQPQQCHLSPLLPARHSSCQPSEHSTPTTSQSPSPRPASASSGFFDSSLGSLVGDSSGGSRRSFTQSFSEMLEFQLTLSGCGNDVTAADSGGGMSSESMPMIPRGRLSPSSSCCSSSVHQEDTARCRSQPTVLVGGSQRIRRDSHHLRHHHHQRLSRSSTGAPGKKRRWPLIDECRPKLDFLKMTEVCCLFSFYSTGNSAFEFCRHARVDYLYAEFVGSFCLYIFTAPQPIESVDCEYSHWSAI